VLIVDDERTFADMLAKRLTLRGFRCRVVYDGLSALEKVRERAFFCVVLDLRLPDVAGTEVLAQVLELRPTLPVIMLTGHGNEADEEKCRDLGAVAFLNKPVGLSRLVSLIKEKGVAST
jgi:DNA-binding response OmpR family regulator